MTYLQSQTETQWEIAHFLNCDTVQSTFDVGTIVVPAGAKSTAVFYVCAANNNYCCFQLHATNHLTFQHIGPTSTHSSHPDQFPLYQFISDVYGHSETEMAGLLANCRSRREATMVLTAAQQTAQLSYIYPLRPNLSRRSSPFIPSGSTDRITAGRRRGRR